jgi:dihydropyrimidine dehydrogenase (NAD+) subunit PreA
LDGYQPSENMNRFDVQFMGIPLINPFILASAPPTATPAMIERSFEAGWAGAVIKTLIDEPVRNLSNRFGINKIGNRIYAFKNIELLSELSPNEWFSGVVNLKKKFPDRLIIGSIMADARDYDGWQRLALGCQEAGMDMVELNFSCPNGYPERGKGCAIGQNEIIASEIVRNIKSDHRITLPIIPKLTPNVTDIAFIGEELAKAGADAFCAINTVPSFLGFDLSTLNPKVNVNGYSTSGGYSGPGIKPIALRCIHELVSSPGIPVMGCGGCMTAEDAIEFLLLGVGAVQLATAVMFKGYPLIQELLSGLLEFMDRHGFETVADFQGKGLQRIKHFYQLDITFKTYAIIDPETCKLCGKCVISCRDGGYQAISIISDDICPYIDPVKCVGCSLCVHVCPFDAIHMDEKRI